MNTKLILIASVATLSLAGCDQPDTDLGDRVTESESNSGSDSESSSSGGTTGGTSDGSGESSSSSGELPQETGDSTGDSTGEPTVSECAARTNTESYADECLPEFCLQDGPIEQPSGDAIFGCSVFGCTPGPDGAIGFQLSEGLTSVSVFFMQGVLDNYTTEGFNENFNRVVGEVEIPGVGGAVWTWVPEQAPNFVYEDGLLQFTLDLGLDSPLYSIESDAEDCISDDVAGFCACFYESLGDVQVSFSAPVEEI